MTAQMLADHDRLIRSVARSLHFKMNAKNLLPYEVDDFIQIGRIGVWQAVVTEEQLSKNRLKTIVERIVEFRIRDAVRNHTGRAHQVGYRQRLNVSGPMSLDGITVSGNRAKGIDGEASLHDILPDPRIQDASARAWEVEELLDTYPMDERDRDILRLRYKGWSMQRIADEYGLTESRISQILQHIRIKHGKRLQQLLAS